MAGRAGGDAIAGRAGGGAVCKRASGAGACNASAGFASGGAAAACAASDVAAAGCVRCLPGSTPAPSLPGLPFWPALSTPANQSTLRNYVYPSWPTTRSTRLHLTTCRGAPLFAWSPAPPTGGCSSCCRLCLFAFLLLLARWSGRCLVCVLAAPPLLSPLPLGGAGLGGGGRRAGLPASAGVSPLPSARTASSRARCLLLSCSGHRPHAVWRCSSMPCSNPVLNMVGKLSQARSKSCQAFVRQRR